MDKKDKFELVDVVALDLENARLKNENTKLHDIIDRAITVLTEATSFLFAARHTAQEKKQDVSAKMEIN